MLSRTQSTAAASDNIPSVCAFCEKTHSDVEGMVASRRAMICPDCIRYLHAMIAIRDDDE